MQEADARQTWRNESAAAKNPLPGALTFALPLALFLAMPGLFLPALSLEEPRESSGETPKLLKAVDYGPLMQQVQKVIKSKWQPPASSKSLKTRVSFMLFKDGRVQGLKTLDSSGDKEFDHSALKAVESALDQDGKLCPLPATAPDSIEIEFSLDYYVESNTFTPAEQIQLLWKNAVEGQLDKLR
ncbi:MAG TPA: energy transducer TonB [Candidatus Obscuribacter sp.]|nr:energy transducer TonB [Candidatus Obscuribacter sp.]HND06669.1 energy transducer TonB [Candidatus Obscuribacter sp.]HNH76385.1 energy transducer TonB [Candidatus Obscuribacter sp.]